MRLYEKYRPRTLADVCGQPAPHGLPDWGWDDGEYSLRVALDVLEDHVITLGVKA